MELLPINRTKEENPQFMDHPDCRASFQMSIDFYDHVGYDPPWIGYYAEVEGKLVGSGAFKGGPKNGTVEIAYGTFPAYRHRGVGTQICRQLVRLALRTDPAIRITARTLPEHNESASILKKNGFKQLGTIWDEDDGLVWEWEFVKATAPNFGFS